VSGDSPETLGDGGRAMRNYCVIVWLCRARTTENTVYNENADGTDRFLVTIAWVWMLRSMIDCDPVLTAPTA
jgi:hypothetical protein